MLRTPFLLQFMTGYRQESSFAPLMSKLIRYRSQKKFQFTATYSKKMYICTIKQQNDVVMEKTIKKEPYEATFRNIIFDNIKWSIATFRNIIFDNIKWSILESLYISIKY